MGTEEQERRLSSSPVNGCPTAWSSRYRTARCGSRHSSLGHPTPAYNADSQLEYGTDAVDTRRLAGPDLLSYGCVGHYAKRTSYKGVHLRFEDVGGYRLVAFATSTRVGQLADLEVRHRLRARCGSDASAAPRTPGSTAFFLQSFTQNSIWCLIVALTCDLLALFQALPLAFAPAPAAPALDIKLIIPGPTFYLPARTV